MGFRLGTIVLGAALAIGAPLIAAAQAPTNPPDYLPGPNDKDLKAVLFNWAWYMVQLRGIDEHELAVSLEYEGKGTLQVDGQPCTLSKYRVSSNYQESGQRINYTCTLPNGQTHSAIEVVRGQYAWNEDIPGAEIVPGQGKATPMPNAVSERLIRLWASPQAAVKAAYDGAGIKLLDANRDPGTRLRGGVDKIGTTSVSWRGGKPSVTFPIPGVEGATAVATLNDRWVAERIVVTHAGTTTEFLYGNYADWNNPLNLIEAQYAGTMVEKRNGTTVRDIETVQTETGNIYVVVPVPESVREAITPGKPRDPPVLFANDRVVALTSKEPTPRRADGKPDLTGSWVGAGMNWRYGHRRCSPAQLEDCNLDWNQTLDFEFEAPSRFGPNRPIYKPEHWDKVIELDMWTNRYDPVMTCQPLGIPRNGPPRRIVQSDKDIIFFYGAYADGGGGQGEYRIMPIDGRPVDPKLLQVTTYMGYTSGRWEGDTLVLDSVGFNDFTWLARGGFFTSDQKRVIERLTRQGNEILYEVTIEDPGVLAEPWVMTPRVLRLSTNPDAHLLPERGNCETYEQDDEDIQTQIRH